MENINILLVTSKSEEFELIKGMLSGCTFQNENSVSKAAKRISSGGIDVIMFDIFLDEKNGLDSLKKMKSKAREVPIVALVSRKNEEVAVQSIDNGADDYVFKEDITKNVLSNSMRYAIERHVLLVELEQYAHELLSNEEHFRNLIANNVDGMVVVDKSKTVRFVNSSAETFFGRKSKDFIGKPFGYAIEPGKTVEVSVGEPGKKITTAEMRVVHIEWERKSAYLASLRDVTDRKQAEEERIKLIRELQDAIVKIKTLSGLLPICAVCKKIRDDGGYWNQIEGYIQEHSSAEFSHAICPDCQKKLYSGKPKNGTAK